MKTNKKPSCPVRRTPRGAGGFDAVKMMRDIREKLSEKYWKNPDILKQEMEAIRQKYNLKIATPKN